MGNTSPESLSAGQISGTGTESTRGAYGLPAITRTTKTAPFETHRRVATVKEAIREHCRLCMSLDRTLPTDCVSRTCELYPFRMASTPHGSGSRVTAIRRYCLQCTGHERAEVARCTGTRCPLWPWRMGHRIEEGYVDAQS